MLTKLLRLLFSYLLSSQLTAHMKSVNDIMPMIGARFYTQLDAAQVKCDVLEGELAKVRKIDCTWAAKILTPGVFHKVLSSHSDWTVMDQYPICFSSKTDPFYKR